jgi:outer membrane protein TolC
MNGVWTNLRAAEFTIAERRDLLLDVQATVLLNVALVYYQVLRSERSVEVLRNSLKLREARLADMQQQFNNGLATRLSVAQTRAGRRHARRVRAGRERRAQRPQRLGAAHRRAERRRAVHGRLFRAAGSAGREDV